MEVGSEKRSISGFDDGGERMREAGKGRKMDSPLDSLELNATHQHLILILKTHFGLWTYEIVRWHIGGVLSW